MRVSKKMISLLLSAGLLLSAAPLSGALPAAKNGLAPEARAATGERVEAVDAIPAGPTPVDPGPCTPEPAVPADAEPAPAKPPAYTDEEPGVPVPAFANTGDEEKEAGILPGDVNGNGEVQVDDARLTMRLSVGLKLEADESPHLHAADLDGDNRITPADARRILRLSLGLPIGEDDPSDGHMAFHPGARMEFDVGEYEDGQIAVKLRLVSCAGLTSGFLRFSYEEGVEVVRIYNGTDAKRIGDIDNTLSREFNRTANPALFGFYFKDCLWDSDSWANAEGADPDALVNGENFECLKITFTTGASADVRCTGELKFCQATLAVDEMIHLPAKGQETHGVCGVVDDDNGLDGSQVTWELNDGVLTISGNGQMRSYDGKPSPWTNRADIDTIVIEDGVLSVGNNAFSDCSALTKVTLPKRLERIGFSAFYNCHELEKIDIPDGVDSIGTNAFAGCRKLKEVNLPNTVTSIEYNLFKDCASLTEITIPDSVTAIEEYAFSGCASLTKAVIPANVTDIRWGIFFGCVNLTELTVCEDNPVYYSAGNCIIDRDTKTLMAGCNASEIPDDGSVTSIYLEAFHGCAGLRTVRIPEGVTSIGASAFFDCTELTEIVIPDSVTSIGSNAFEDCTGLTDVTIPDSVTTIGNNAFSGCTGLTDVTIPNSVNEIGYNAFPDTTVIHCAAGSCAEQWANENGNPVVTKIAPIPVVPTIVASGECGVIDYANGLDGSQVTWTLDEDGTLTIRGNGRMRNYEWWESPWADRNDIVTTVIEDGVTNVGDTAFAYCMGLRTISIPGSVKNIGDDAFTRCFSLTEINLPDGVKTIGARAFFECSALTKMNIPGSVEWIDAGAFAECSSLTELTVGADNPVYRGAGNCIIEKAAKKLIAGCNTSEIPDDGSVTIIGEKAFEGFYELERITIPDSVTYIADYAFSGCWNLTEIHIPDGVTCIASHAFSHCSGLTGITIPDSVTYIGNGAFSGCTGLTKLTVSEDNPVYCSIGNCIIEKETKTLTVGCKSSEIPADGSVTIIGMEAFKGCAQLTDITIPNGVTVIGVDAFSECGLKEVTLPDGLTRIERNAFINCTELTKATIPSSVTKIENSVFWRETVIHCEKGSYAEQWANMHGYPVEVDDSAGSSLTGGECGVIDYANGLDGSQMTWELNDGVLTISGTGAMRYYLPKESPWYNRSDIVSVVIENGVTSIGDFAFQDCCWLTDVHIPDGVDQIGSEVFWNCASLKEIALPDSLRIISGWAFEDCTGLTEVNIPDGVTSIDSCVFEGCTGLRKATIPDGVTQIGEDAFPESTVIRCHAGSYAEEWALQNGRAVQLICEEHTWDEGETTHFVNCEEGGEKLLTCTVCGEQQTVKIPAAPHTPGEPRRQGVTEATCTKEGHYVEVVYCVVCNREISRETKTVEKQAHRFGEWTVRTPATAAAEGEKTRTCAVCGETESAVIPKLTPAEASPTDATPSDATPSDATPSDATPSDAKPSDAKPSDATPSDATPSDATPSDATPSNATPSDATPSDATPSDVVVGDVDRDGEITSADARLALRQSVKLEAYAKGSAKYLACDADGDGEITSGDARMILRASVKLEDPAEWGKKTPASA